MYLDLLCSRVQIVLQRPPVLLLLHTQPQASMCFCLCIQQQKSYNQQNKKRTVGLIRFPEVTPIYCNLLSEQMLFYNLEDYNACAISAVLFYPSHMHLMLRINSTLIRNHRVRGLFLSLKSTISSTCENQIFLRVLLLWEK